jgi:hypothetical protein
VTGVQPEFVEGTRQVSRQIAIAGDRGSIVKGTRENAGKDPERKRYVREKRLEAGLPVFREAFLTVDRSSFRWLERYFAFFSAV